jgi:hypothetical protein
MDTACHTHYRYHFFFDCKPGNIRFPARFELHPAVYGRKVPVEFKKELAFCTGGKHREVGFRAQTK